MELSARATTRKGGDSVKLKKEFVTRTVGGTQVAAADVSAFGGMVRSDETAAFVAGCLERETTPEAVISALYAEGDAPIAVAAADVGRTLRVFRELGALEE